MDHHQQGTPAARREGRPTVSLIISTYNRPRALDRVLAGGELGAFFEATRCAEEGASKPDPWMLQSLSEEMGVSPTQMVMVGDSIYDIEMARAFGCASIGVYYDTGTPLMLQSSEPDAMAGTGGGRGGGPRPVQPSGHAQCDLRS